MKQNNQKFISVGDYCEYIIKKSSIIEMKEEFTLLTEEGEIVLDVTISADFEEVPEKYKEIFINMLTSKYMNRVTLTSNLFSKYSEPEKRNLFQKIKKLFKK